MKQKITAILAILLYSAQEAKALNPADVSVRMISGYYWMDNSCTVAGPQGKVTTFRVINTKGTKLYGVSITLGTITFTAAPSVSYTSGTPSFTNQTSPTVYIGDIEAGDSATAFFYVGYNCLRYPNNTNITTDYITLPVTLRDNLAGTVSTSFNQTIYVLRNSNNNTITILATSLNTVGTMATLSVAYNISNVKPGNIIDMQISTLSTFPAGYEIMGCKITSTTISADFPLNSVNTHYSGNIQTNSPSGGTVTIEWYLKITGTSTGLNSSNLVPFVVSDAGSAQRWQANTTSFTGTSVPVNPITITKRVNVQDVLVGDTVFYTVVIRNSSITADVTIDRIIDNLPRDYQFRYINQDTGIFPRLVTNANSTQIPEYGDTNYLRFEGHKQMGGGTFSWVVPKQDSIKLIYSVVVSSDPGLLDTNFVSPYVGSTPLDTAHAIVNVYLVLPVRLIYFNAVRNGAEAELRWALSGSDHGTRFRISRQNTVNGEYEIIGEFMARDRQTVFTFTDQSELLSTGDHILYQLEVTAADGSGFVAEASLDNDALQAGYKVITNEKEIRIYALSPQTSEVNVSLYDVTGKMLYKADLVSDQGYFVIPLNDIDISLRMMLLDITSGQRSYYQKIFTN